MGTMHPHPTERAHVLLQPRSAELEAHAHRDMPLVIRAALDRAGWTPGTVEVVAPHQHTRRIIVQVLTHIGIDPGRAAFPLAATGNAASANIPLALAEARRQGRLRPGARTLLCGGSAGFSAIATALVW
jgi:3-oxoacyl-[acyl-carrier-protein] synthase-3